MGIGVESGLQFTQTQVSPFQRQPQNWSRHCSSVSAVATCGEQPSVGDGEEVGVGVAVSFALWSPIPALLLSSRGAAKRAESGTRPAE